MKISISRRMTLSIFLLNGLIFSIKKKNKNKHEIHIAQSRIKLYLQTIRNHEYILNLINKTSTRIIQWLIDKR